MKTKCVLFETFFLDYQLNSSTHKILNSNYVVQNISTNGDQRRKKLQDGVQKNFIFNFEF